MSSQQPKWILVRSTITLPGLRAGEEALVDPAQLYIQVLLRNRHLVRVEQELASQPHADADTS